ncbi:MAG TPA: PDZ domain-containing protein, partial [Alphaproteobacteria bacterium]|nr:PDZ domain-containing protein [Alphaproteobacteria bacterium]
RIANADGKTFPALTFGNSDNVEVGDLVLAIGNPFGVGQTVTSGIVSALARNAGGISDYSFFIQTDAAINPGNSGGALVAMDGSLVGINTAIYSRSGGSLGIGFAIPASMVRAVIASLDNGGRIVRPWLGAGGQDLTPDIAESLGLEVPRGVLINRVHPGGPADRAGLRVGDVVVALDGIPVDTTEGLRFRVATLPIAETATLTVRRDGQEIDLPLTAEPAPEVPPRNVTVLDGPHPLAGAVVANLSPALIEETGYEGVRRTGVVVLEVGGRSPAQRLGLEPGDVVVSINGADVADVRDLRNLLDRASESWRIGIQRGERVLETVVIG